MCAEEYVRSVGDYPYNAVTLTGLWNLTYDASGEGMVKTTKGYTCDMFQSRCRTEDGVVLEPGILRAWS